MEEFVIVEQDMQHWNRKLWGRAFICIIFILLTVPAARSIQQIVYRLSGKDFFTYAVIVTVLAALCMLIYVFIFIQRIRNLSQYFWLMACSGMYVYVTLQLGKRHPEEAVHLLEYGLLAYFVFRALGHRIRDWTVYATTALIVFLAGALDEFIQWLLPGRVWDYKDLGINVIGGGIFLIAVHRGVRPRSISGPVQAYSVKIFLRSVTAVIILLGMFLSNTPAAVNRYTSMITALSWLRKEETMTYAAPGSLSTPEIWLMLLLLLTLLWIFGKKWERSLTDSRKSDA